MLQDLTLTLGQIAGMAGALTRSWDEHKGSLKMKGKSLYALIGIKKELEKRLEHVQETIASLALQHGGEFDPEIGGFKIPDDQQVAANEAIAALTKTESTFSFAPIILTEEDYLPPEILDSVYDFVIMAE